MWSWPCISFGASTTVRLDQISGVDTYVRDSVPTQSWGTDPEIQTGGWGDLYYTLIKFNVA